MFSLNSIVLARQKYSISWPARVVNIEKKNIRVYFFGDKREGLVSASEIYDFEESSAALKGVITSSKIPRGFLTGIREVELLLKIPSHNSIFFNEVQWSNSVERNFLNGMHISGQSKRDVSDRFKQYSDLNEMKITTNLNTKNTHLIVWLTPAPENNKIGKNVLQASHSHCNNISYIHWWFIVFTGQDENTIRIRQTDLRYNIMFSSNVSDKSAFRRHELFIKWTNYNLNFCLQLPMHQLSKLKELSFDWEANTLTEHPILNILIDNFLISSSHFLWFLWFIFILFLHIFLFILFILRPNVSSCWKFLGTQSYRDWCYFLFIQI